MTGALVNPPATLVRDPVCGMEFNPAGAAATRTLDGTTHYFCAERCARQFDREHGLGPETPLMTAEHVAYRRSRLLSTLPGWVVPAVCGVAIAAIVAVTVFGVSLSSLLLYSVVLLCPLMHFFMMRGQGHGSHGHGHGHGSHGSHGSQQSGANACHGAPAEATENRVMKDTTSTRA